MLVLVGELRTETNEEDMGGDALKGHLNPSPDFMETGEPEVPLCAFGTPRVFRDALVTRRWSVSWGLFIAAQPIASPFPENRLDDIEESFGSWELAPLPEFLKIAPGDM